MIFPYTIDKNIFEFEDCDFDLWCERVGTFTEVIGKQSLWVDCQLNATHAAIYKKVKTCQNQNIKSALFEFWKKYFWGKNRNVKNNCDCDDTEVCDISILTNKVIEYYEDVKFIFSNDDLSGHIENVSVEEYRDSSAYSYCIKYTEIDVGPFNNEHDSDEFLRRNWGWAFKLAKQITIIDKIAFKCWKQDEENYKKGLNQFCRIVNDVNPQLKTQIISLLATGGNGESKEELYSAVTNSVLSLEPPVEFCLVDRSDVFRHDRYILFHKIFGAYLSTGLTNFSPNSNINSIVYHNREIIEGHIGVAEHDIIKYDKFKPIRNFQ